MRYNVFMTWALKRQMLYVLILIILAGGLGLLFFFSYFTKPPTCFDGKLNGKEDGIDCGGSCKLACYFKVDEISILWARAFLVVPGRYNAVAYIENHNGSAAVEKIKYRFRFADKDNIYIGKREGETFIPPGGKFAIFEPAIGVGNSMPVYTTFEFSEVPRWSQVPQEKIRELKVAVSDINLQNEQATPILLATIKNNSLFRIPAVNVIAILYGSDGNALSASRTYLKELRSEEEKIVTFTWPEPFSEEAMVKEIIPMFDIFGAKLE